VNQAESVSKKESSDQKEFVSHALNLQAGCDNRVTIWRKDKETSYRVEKVLGKRTKDGIKEIEILKETKDTNITNNVKDK